MPIPRLLTAAVLLGGILGAVGTAQADFRVCNHSPQRVDIALAYPEPPLGWTSEGWWSLAVGQCTTLLKRPLSSRYYHLYATGTHGGVWEAPPHQRGGFFCTRSSRFLFHSRSVETPRLLDCAGPGVEIKHFLKVDTGGAASHVQNLSD